MKSVLISIQPKWVEKIVKGEKTIEVRKSRPKIETPFKCYIYCTYGKENENYMLGKRGKVVGEFVCDWITEITPSCDIKDFVNHHDNHRYSIRRHTVRRRRFPPTIPCSYILEVQLLRSTCKYS